MCPPFIIFPAAMAAVQLSKTKAGFFLPQGISVNGALEDR
jgi:hypothetical protein